MKKIYIGFSKPKGKFPLLSWIIRGVEGTEYSHVYVRWMSDRAGAWICYEASGTTVRFLGNRLFQDTRHVVHEFDIQITEDQYTDLLKFCIENAGVHYGFLQLVGIGIVRLADIAGFEIKNPLSDGRRSQVCSELVGNILKEVLQLDIEEDLDVAGPRQIYEFMEYLVDDRKAKRST